MFVETMSTNFKRNRQFSLCGEIVFHSIVLEVDYFHIYLFEHNNWPQINMKHCVNVIKIMGRNIVGISYYFLLILTVYFLYQLLGLSENRQAILCKAIAKVYLHNYWWFRAIIPRAVCKEYSAPRHLCLFWKISEAKGHQESEKERKWSF